MIRRILLAALLLISPPVVAQDTLTASTAPAPTQVRLPLVRSVQDGDRVVLQVVGSTTTPIGSTDGLYIGPNGYTADVDAAQDVRGLPGLSGNDVETVGPQGPMGAPGKSTYQLWLDAGNEGSRDQFLATLRGAQGVPGGPGTAGRSAYEVWLDAGNTGTAQQFLESLAGRPGLDGAPGAAGSVGPAGLAAEMRVGGGYIQWRAGGSWSNLVSLADLRGTDGTAGAKGDKGDKGDTGSAGGTGATGATGATPQLTVGVVTTLPAGASATATLTGPATAPVLNLGLPTGATGAASPTSVVFLSNVTMAQTTLISLSAGVRDFTVATNCAVGDRIVLTPAGPIPAGYMLGDAYCSAAGTMIAKLFTPQLAIGVSYSITARPVAFR